MISVAASLALVGLISDTLLRHVVQMVPVLFALGLVMKTPGAGAYIAMAVLAFWVLIMVLTWLYLLGLSDIAAGTYSTGEVILTFAIPTFSVWGISKSVRMRRPLAWTGSLAVFLGSFALQAGFMALSFQL